MILWAEANLKTANSTVLLPYRTERYRTFTAVKQTTACTQLTTQRGERMISIILI